MKYQCNGAILEIQITKRASRVSFVDVSPTANEQVVSSPIYFGSHAYAIESLESILKNSLRKGDKDPRDFDRTRDTDCDEHMVCYMDRSLRGKRVRDTDSDSDVDSYHRSRSYLRVRYEHRSRSQSRSPSKRKRLSSFDIAHLASTSSSGGGAVMAPTVPEMFQNMPVQLMTQKATRHARRVYVGGISLTSVATFFSYVMAAIRGNTAGLADAVVNVYINHEKTFAFVEMRYVEEANNAIALDVILLEGAPVKVKIPSDCWNFTIWLTINRTITMTKIIKREFEKPESLKISDDSFTCNTSLEILQEEFDWMSIMDNDLSTYKVEISGLTNIPCDLNEEDDLEQQMTHESNDDMKYDLSNDEFIEWAFKEFNYLLQIDPDVLTKDIEGYKTYEYYKDD
nr:splicing factor U2af large subunit B isoform X2 [Tanacetum cinerariifolium]